MNGPQDGSWIDPTESYDSKAGDGLEGLSVEKIEKHLHRYIDSRRLELRKMAKLEEQLKVAKEFLGDIEDMNDCTHYINDAVDWAHEGLNKLKQMEAE